MCNKSVEDTLPVAVNAVKAVIFLSAIFSPFKINVNPPYFRGECYSRDSRPLALYNYYANTVCVTAVSPERTNDAARLVPPRTVSEIVPPARAIFAPPNVKTSSSAIV